VEDFEEPNPKSSPLDSMDQLHSALDSIEGRSPADKMKEPQTRSHVRVRSVGILAIDYTSCFVVADYMITILG